MDNLTQYNLIQAIDPTKVKIPISDRFAKLTLSSNKKKQQQPAKDGQQEEGCALEVQPQKRDSISRNLLKQLSGDIGEAKIAPNQDKSFKHNDEAAGKNPLLRSESSKDTDNNNSMTLEEAHETMEPLNVSEDEDSITQLQLDEDLQVLSQRIASMAMVSRPTSCTISLSSDSTEHLSELTQLVSTESQRSSMAEVERLHIIRNIEVNVAEAIKHDRISINSEQAAEMTEDEVEEEIQQIEVEEEEEIQQIEVEEEEDIQQIEVEKEEEIQQIEVEEEEEIQQIEIEEEEIQQIEIQEEVGKEHKEKGEEENDKKDVGDDDEEEDSDDDDDDDPITISDTTESHHDIEPNEMFTSAIPSTTQTSENLQLPCMPDDKAERVAAFLRDVSMERRVMEEHGHIEFNDTVDQLLDNEAIDKISDSLAKSRQIASADTESMTPDVGDEVTPISIIEREKRMKALEDSIARTHKTLNKTIPEETQDKTIMTEDDDEEEEQYKSPKLGKNLETDLETPKILANLNISLRLNSPKRLQNVEQDHRRLAYDETQLNSEFSSMDLNKTPKIQSNLNSPKRYNTPKHNQNSQTNQRRLALAETQDNTDISLTESNKTPKIHSNLNSPKRYNSPKRAQNSETSQRRLALAETQDNTDISLTESNKTPKIHSNLNFPKRYNSPKRYQNSETNQRRLALAETQGNTEFPLTDSNKTPKTHSNLNSPKHYQSPKHVVNAESDEHRLAHLDTEENSEVFLTQISKTPKFPPNLNSHKRYNSPKPTQTKENQQSTLINDGTQINSEFSSAVTNISSKIHSNLNTPKFYKSPHAVQNTRNQGYNLAEADTVVNSDNSSPNIVSNTPPNLKSPQPPQNTRNPGRNLAEADTEINSDNSSPPIIPNTPPNHNSSNRLLRKSKNSERNLANDDTIANSLMTSLSSSQPYDFSKDLKTPERDKKYNEALDNSLAKASSSENLSDTINSSSEHNSLQQKSHNSIINSSSENNSPTPQDSITILETDDEESMVSNNNKTSAQASNYNSDDNKKLSNSFHKEDSLICISSSDDDDDDDDQMSQIRMSMAKINISAKINIKIHIPAQSSSTETSEGEEQNEEGGEQEENERKSLENEGTGSKNNRSSENDRRSSENDEISSENNRRSSENERTSSRDNRRSSENEISSENNRKSSENDSRSSENERTSSENDRKSSEHDRTSSENVRTSSENDKSPEAAKKTSKEKFSRPCNQLQLKPPVQTDGLTALNVSSDSDVEIVEDKKFFTEAERLLNQLYGNSWQTPDVIRTLKRSCQTDTKKPNKSKTPAAKKKENLKNLKDDKPYNKSAVEESILDDFSMFRQNIVKTNLDSTRLVTPKTTNKQRLMKNTEISTEPRNTKTTSKRKEDKPIIPQTERKPVSTPVAKVVINKDRINNDRWRLLIDNNSDSEGDNASDDDDADKSWSKIASEIEEASSDSDFEISPKSKSRNRKNTNTNKRRQRYNSGRDKLTQQLNKSKEGDIVYLDLSKEEVEVQEDVPESPPANHDAGFATHLQDILKTCRHEDKAKLPTSTTKTKRKLFTPNFGDDDAEGVAAPIEEPKLKENAAKLVIADSILDDYNSCPFDSQGRPKILDLVNKKLESVKTGKPIFQLTPSPTKKKTTPLSTKNYKTKETATPKSKKDDNLTFKTPLTIKTKVPKALKDLSETPDYKYSFLKSLDVQVSKSFCHPDALYYRENYRTKKEDLSKILYDMYNEKLFQNKIDVPITWNKKLSNTAGRCLNKKKLGTRLSSIELSDKVLTSADRLRCTLIHELCHAATWILNGEGGHGSTWKEWARRANATFPEIPKIGVCHQYDIEYKYTYKCTLCSAKSHAHSKSKKVENIRCSYCHGAIEVFLNKKDKDGNIMPTPVKEPTGFAKFVKDNYKKFKRDDRKHADVMKLLSSEFATLKLTTNAN